jgi:cellulose synthase/poly-beta-1,6-N-acetylglucosamine synthase-like glycosyltransferase
MSKFMMSRAREKEFGRERPAAENHRHGNAVERRTSVAPSEDDLPPASVTVIIPCFNYARYLPKAIASALSQTEEVVDVIVVDDASTDDSLAVASAMAAADARIQVIAHPKNAGPVQTFNDGLAVAQGEFLVRLDADDLLTPGSLKRAVAVMRRFPSVGLVYGHPLHFTGDALGVPRTNSTRWTIWPGQQWLRDRCHSGYNVITSPEVLMRRSVVAMAGGQKELAHTHDMEMWLRLSAFSDVAYIQGADQAWHREHPESLSARRVDALLDLKERKAAFDLLFSSVGERIVDARASHEAAMRAIAAQALQLAAVEYDHGRESPDLVAALIDLARATTPDVESTPGWAQLNARRQLGASRTARRPGAMLARARRKLQRVVQQHRWHTRGVV